MRCPFPESVPRKNGYGPRDRISVPCGKCSHCLKQRRQEWTVRLLEELKTAKKGIFLTLTYDEKNLPGKGLDKVHIQAYFKALRKKLPQKIRYYAVGEYGTTTHRPHYHCIIFNMGMDDYNNVNDIWSYGNTFGVDVNIRSISYVAKYHVNKTSFPDGKSPPFALMSKGIGRCYIEKMKDFHKGNISRSYYPDFDKKRRLPRYWKLKLYNEKERKEIAETDYGDDLFSMERQADYERKNPGQSYFEYINQKLINHEKKFKEKANHNNKV